MASVTSVAKAEIIKQLCKILFNFEPKIVYYANYCDIILSSEQQVTIRHYIEILINKQKSSTQDIRINILPSLLPLIIKKVFPFVSGVFGAGFLLGKNKK
jgi:hypothetical protein